MMNMRSHSDSKGFELKRPNDSVYSYPCPDCMCRVNRTEDSRSSSVTWPRNRFWLLPTVIFVDTSCWWLQFFHLAILSFFPLPAWWEGLHFNFGSFKDLMEFAFIRLFPGTWNGEAATFCTWCQRTQTTFYPGY
jgi:hypothetical protein